MYFIANRDGFIIHPNSIITTRNVREAFPFLTYGEAHNTAEMLGLGYFAILKGENIPIERIH